MPGPHCFSLTVLLPGNAPRLHDINLAPFALLFLALLSTSLKLSNCSIASILSPITRMSPQFSSIDAETASQRAASPHRGESASIGVDLPVSSPVSTYPSPTARIASNNEIRISLEEPPRSLDKPKSPARAWLVLLGAWCASFCSFGWINSNYSLLNPTVLSPQWYTDSLL